MKTQPTYLHPEDASIIREPDRPGEARLYDCDGDHRYTFPATWTDEQVMGGLRFANHAFRLGHEIGDAEARREIRAALGVTEPPQA